MWRLLVVLILGGVASLFHGTVPSLVAEEAGDVAATQPSPEREKLRFVERLQERRQGDDEADITALAESPDGKALAWGDCRGTIRVHSFDHSLTTTILDMSQKDITEGREVLDLGFDKDGRLWWLDLSSDVWCANPGEGGQWFIVREGTVPGSGVVLSSNVLPGGVLGIGDKFSRWLPRDFLMLRLLGNHNEVYSSEAVFPRGHGVATLIRIAVRSPDGKMLMGVADRGAVLFRLPDLAILRRFGQVWGYSAAFSPSSRRVALGTNGKGAFVWETDTGKIVGKISGVGGKVSCLAFVGEDILYLGSYPLWRADLIWQRYFLVSPLFAWAFSLTASRKSSKCVESSAAILRTGSLALAADVNVNAMTMLPSRSGDRLFVGVFEGGLEVFELPASDRSQKPPKTAPVSVPASAPAN